MTVPTTTGPFDRQLWRQRRSQATERTGPFHRLHQTVATELAERLELINRQFSTAMVIGTGLGAYVTAVTSQPEIATVVQVDANPEWIAQPSSSGPCRWAVAADEERLPFATPFADLAIAGMTLHWVNDLTGTLIQIRRCLRPDGLLIGAMAGGETLHELRECLADAEIEVEGGLSPRVAPMVEVRTLGNLLQRAEFALPVVDVERHQLWFPDAQNLMAELRRAGEANALRDRRGVLPAPTLARACQLYEERYSRDDGQVRATIDVVYMCGWAPHHDQPQPLRPGSAATRLADALGTEEVSLGEAGAPSGAGTMPNRTQLSHQPCQGRDAELHRDQ